MSTNYKLEMDGYFDKIVEAKIKRLNQMQKNIGNGIEKIYLSQQNFIDAVEYFFYPIKQKEIIFNELKKCFADNYQSLVSIKKNKLNFETSKDAYSSIEFMLEKIKKFANSRNSEVLNTQVWDRIIIQ